MADSDPIFFIHVPKTGGSSLHSMIIDSVDPQDCKSSRGHSAIQEAESRGWKNCTLVSGHFEYDQVAKIDHPLRIITILRDPIDRVMSLYWYSHTITDEEAAMVNCPITNFARVTTPEDFFLEAPSEVRPSFENTVARQLVGHERFHDWLEGRAGDSEILQIARERLESMSAIALVDQFETTVSLLFNALDLPIVRFREDNMLAERIRYGHAEDAPISRPSDRLRRYLEGINLLDRAIFEFASDLIKSRIDAAMRQPQRSASRASGM